jgi:hypothetical protein
MVRAMAVPLVLVREAFDSAGEKHFRLARFFYSILFGRNWMFAILGFAYLKCLDDVVDEDVDTNRALGVLARQKRLIDRAYGGESVRESLPSPERFGLPFFLYDRAHGNRLRTAFETVLSSMQFDTRRRGRLIGAAALDAYVVQLGSTVFRYLQHFAAPEATLDDRFAAVAARAYLYADALIDLRHDLRLGIVNVPEEDIVRYRLSLDLDDPHLRAWMARRAAFVLEQFEQALGLARRLESRPLRLLSRLYLSTKRRSLHRFLAGERLAAGAHAAAACEDSGST